MPQNHNELNKLRKETILLESELAAIRGSRAYRLSRALGLVKAKLKENPTRAAGKALKLILKNPANVLALLKGGQLDTNVRELLENRLINYHRWVALNEPTEDELAQQRSASEQFKNKPIISIITPVFNPPVPVLQDLIESVLGQTYPYFELCLGNFGQDPAVKNLLAEYATEDSRIRVFEFTENLGIAGNSNLLLEKVTSEYIALLDHDDTISPDALYENAKLINYKTYDFIYSDKDMIDEQGNRFEPLFKPDWSPEIMLSANYLTHFNIMRTEVVREVGGWDTNTNGAQDWDIFLKVIAASKNPIGHIPKILYHWRVIATSTALSIETKPYALEGQRRAIQKYLDKNHIHATPRHEKTEVLLNWKPEAVDQKPLIGIVSHAVADTLRLLTRLKQTAPTNAKIIVFTNSTASDSGIALLRKQGAHEIINYKNDYLSTALNKTLTDAAIREQHGTLILLDDSIQLPKGFAYNDLVGFLSIEGVGAVGAKIMNYQHLIIDFGALVDSLSIQPIFHGYPSYYNGYLGNVEWVRNLRLISRHLVAVKLSALPKQAFDERLPDELVVAGMLITLGSTQRLVVNPKVVGYRSQEVYTELDNSLIGLIQEVFGDALDPYGNANLDPQDPMHLNIGSNGLDTSSSDLTEYQTEALILSRAFDLTDREMKQNLAVTAKLEPITARSAALILPSFNVRYAGLTNIFSFAAFLARKKNLDISFVILKGSDDLAEEHDIVVGKYPELSEAKFISATPDNFVDKMPKVDIGICTQWATAYMLAKSNQIGRKCYFIQDYEPNFYPKGSISALAEETYKFSFFALANTPGLFDIYKNRFNGKGVVVKSLVDLSDYHPNEDRHRIPSKPYKVFFYARPNMPRNAFELGLAGLSRLKQQLGDQVEVTAAGAEWNEAAYGMTGIVKNLGKIPYEKVPELYRNADAGLMFMFSGHPGVTASELMASGCPVVVNEYDDTTWNDLYRHEQTCLITKPTASEVARNLRRCLEDNKLRHTLIDNGLKKVKDFYAGYNESLEEAYQAILSGHSR